MTGWITFWTWVYIISCTAGAIMFLLIVPFGIRDLVRLYHFLNTQVPTEEDS
jgi:hypothetical protein